METKPMTEVERLRAEVEALKLIAVVLCDIAKKAKPELPALLQATVDGYKDLLLYTKLTDQQREWMAKTVAGATSPPASGRTDPPGP
jgi:hypothetical protein